MLFRSVGKESACNAGDLGSIPGSGRSPGEGNANPLQDSCLENPMDRGAWRATVHRAAKSQRRPFDPASLSLETSLMDGYIHAQINKGKRILLATAIEN